MKQENILVVLVFVLALFFLGFGIALSAVKETVRINRYPYEQTIQPYAEGGGFLIIIGVVCLIIAFAKLRGFP